MRGPYVLKIRATRISVNTDSRTWVYDQNLEQHTHRDKYISLRPRTQHYILDPATTVRNKTL
jgi:hypothetical protein